MKCKRLLFFLLTGLLHASVAASLASPYTMKAPPGSVPVAHKVVAQPTSPLRNVLLGAINFYRQVISPTQGGRCGFYPSCSAFGLHAVQHYGAIKGSLLTADRLTRCNIFKQPGPDYYQRPDGRLYDPVEANLLKEL